MGLTAEDIRKLQIIAKYRPILAKKLGLNIEEVFPEYKEEENEHTNT
jgi:hypothetical protein